MITVPSPKTLVQLMEKKHAIVLALLANIKDWLPQANSVHEAVDLLGLDPDEYFEHEENATADTIEIQQKWIARQVDEQASAILASLYGQSETLIMDKVNNA